MKVSQIRLAGHGDGPPLALADLGPELTAVYGPPRTGKSTAAQLVAHLLYGKTDVARRQAGGAVPPLVDGSIDVTSPQGAFVLRRHRDGSPHGRLTVASAAGAGVDGRTVRSLLGDLSPALLAELYAIDFAAAPQAGALLEGEFARQFTLALGQEGADEPAPPGVVCHEHAAAPPLGVDRRRVDELVRRRDEVVRHIEVQMGSRRRDSAALEQELAQLDATLAARRAEADELATKLRAVEAKLAEIAARLRYYSLETAVRPPSPGDLDERREALDRLDQEIGRCRQMLADLQTRDGAVRRELAEVHPDGTADSVASLAEQRATVGVLETLLDDLDAEVAGLARSHDPGRCIAADAHGRMLPVAQMLRQQLYALCGQVTEQERALRRGQLRAELRQLSRAQSDLSEQLEHLLERRQSQVYESQLAGRVAVAAPQPPVARHCQCERHEEFIRNADELLLTRGGRVRYEDEARARRAELEEQRQRLREAADAVARDMSSLAARWERLQAERTQTAERSTLDDLRSELEQLELEIHRALHAPAAAILPLPGAATHRRAWKASDVLAQLTGGQLTQIRLSPAGRAPTIVDRDGRLLVIEDLSPQQNDQLYLAVTLALTSSLASRGVDLPLVLDEPFLRQDAPAAAAMAGVLAEFARQGRQTFVFTADREAARRLETLGVDVRNIDDLRRVAPAPAGPIARPAAIAPAPAPTVRIVREALADGDRSLRVVSRRPAVAEQALDKPVFYLTVDASLADFPVLGNDTAFVFSSLGIRTIEDLLAADAADVARRLAHPAVAADAVRLWQQHTSLMCFVPGVSLVDAQVLAACEINSPEALFTIDVRLLADAIARFLATERGRRFGSSRERFSIERLALLQKHARRQRDRWQLLCPRYGWVERTAPTKSATPKKLAKPAAARKQTDRPGKTKQPRRTSTPSPRLARPIKERPLRFLLDRGSPVAEAPSISGAMAGRLTQVGVRTVADLLNANPESAAAELAVRNVTATTIVRWQQQARLACRIPELRGCGAQLLVACGFTEPEQIAGASVAELVGKVRAVCRTTEGKRLLRAGEVPGAARVAAWIRHAAHTRPLEAA
jgi:hypothetical protein